MRSPTVILPCVCAAVLCTGSALAQLHGWTDDNGTFHIEEDLSLIPPEFRAAAAERGRQAENRQIQIVRPEGDEHPARVPIERFGQLIRVSVRLNDAVEAAFVIDTGADGLAIPVSIATELGLVDAQARIVTMNTANGRLDVASVKLESVEVGGARVEAVPAVINPRLEFGLLGQSFLHHFKYTIDAENEVLILEPRTPPVPDESP